MLTEITYKDLPFLEFPVYFPNLKDTDWDYLDGVLFLQNKVLDEKNMPGETLGIRRLQCGRDDLYPLKKAVNTIGDLIKSKRTIFIDNNGKYCSYRKTKWIKIVTHVVVRIQRKETFSLVWIMGVNIPFKIIRPPYEKVKWCQVLYLNDKPWMFYGFINKFQKSTRKKI